MKKSWVLGFFSLISVVAQGRVIDWQTGLSLLQQNNPELAAAKNTYEGLRSLEGASRSGFLPDLSAGVSSTQNYNESSSAQTQRSESVSLTFSQNLFAGFSDLNKYREAQQNTLIAEFQYRQTKAKISKDYKVAYAGLIYAQESKVLTQNILLRRKGNLNIVQLRFASGRENKGSVLVSEAYLQQAVYDSMQAELQLDVAQNTLAQALGISIGDDKINVPKDIPAEGIPELVESDFKRLAIQTLDYQKAVAQSSASLFNYEQSKSDFYPSLDLTGTLGKSDSVFPPENDRWSIGLNLKIPIYSGGRDLSELYSARYQRISAEINQMTVSYQVLVKLKQAYSQFKLAIERIKVDEKFMQAAEMRSEIARKKYNNGLMSFEDWNQVENDRIQREKNSLSSFRDRMVEEANWQQTQGVGLLQ